jgi:hypothetical protein
MSWSKRSFLPSGVEADSYSASYFLICNMRLMITSHPIQRPRLAWNSCPRVWHGHSCWAQRPLRGPTKSQPSRLLTYKLITCEWNKWFLIQSIDLPLLSWLSSRDLPHSHCPCSSCYSLFLIARLLVYICATVLFLF